MEMKKTSEEKSLQQGIDRTYTKKELLKNFIIFGLVTVSSYLSTIYIIWAILLDPTLPPLNPYSFSMLSLILFIAIVGIPMPVSMIISKSYYNKYIDNFSYALKTSHLEITHGVFTKNRATIPYSRVQNINIKNGIFDRMYKLNTIYIETAGTSNINPSGGGYGKPEGYIPAVKDPKEFETELKKMLDKYNVLPSGLEDKIFKPQELAFDNFISYVLSKMRSQDDLLKTNLKTLRDKNNMSIATLADKVGVKNDTIELLEAGRYTPSLSLAYKISRELNCRIEDLFIF